MLGNGEVTLSTSDCKKQKTDIITIVLIIAIDPYPLNKIFIE